MLYKFKNKIYYKYIHRIAEAYKTFAPPGSSFFGGGFSAAIHQIIQKQLDDDKGGKGLELLQVLANIRFYAKSASSPRSCRNSEVENVNKEKVKNVHRVNKNHCIIA
jgi:hypothetical protein